jgi:hypothetical protein
VRVIGARTPTSMQGRDLSGPPPATPNIPKRCAAQSDRIAPAANPTAKAANESGSVPQRLIQQTSNCVNTAPTTIEAQTQLSVVPRPRRMMLIMASLPEERRATDFAANGLERKPPVFYRKITDCLKTEESATLFSFTDQKGNDATLI